MSGNGPTGRGGGSRTPRQIPRTPVRQQQGQQGMEAQQSLLSARLQRTPLQNQRPGQRPNASLTPLSQSAASRAGPFVAPSPALALEPNLAELGGNWRSALVVNGLYEALIETEKERDTISDQLTSMSIDMSPERVTGAGAGLTSPRPGPDFPSFNLDGDTRDRRDERPGRHIHFQDDDAAPTMEYSPRADELQRLREDIASIGQAVETSQSRLIAELAKVQEEFLNRSANSSGNTLSGQDTPSPAAGKRHPGSGLRIGDGISPIQRPRYSEEIADQSDNDAEKTPGKAPSLRKSSADKLNADETIYLTPAADRGSSYATPGYSLNWRKSGDSAAARQSPPMQSPGISLAQNGGGHVAAVTLDDIIERDKLLEELEEERTLKEENKAKVVKIQTESEMKLAELRRESEAKAAELLTQGEARLKELQAQSEAQTEELKAETEAKIAELRAQSEARQVALQAEADRRFEEAQRLQQLLAVTEAARQALHRDMSAATGRLNKLEFEASRSRRQLEEQSLSLQKLRNLLERHGLSGGIQEELSSIIEGVQMIGSRSLTGIAALMGNSCASATSRLQMLHWYWSHWLTLVKQRRLERNCATWQDTAGASAVAVVLASFFTDNPRSTKMFAFARWKRLRALSQIDGAIERYGSEARCRKALQRWSAFTRHQYRNRHLAQRLRLFSARQSRKLLRTYLGILRAEASHLHKRRKALLSTISRWTRMQYAAAFRQFRDVVVSLRLSDARAKAAQVLEELHITRKARDEMEGKLNTANELRLEYEIRAAESQVAAESQLAELRAALHQELGRKEKLLIAIDCVSSSVLRKSSINFGIVHSRILFMEWRRWCDRRRTASALVIRLWSRHLMSQLARGFAALESVRRFELIQSRNHSIAQAWICRFAKRQLLRRWVDVCRARRAELQTFRSMQAFSARQSLRRWAEACRSRKTILRILNCMVLGAASRSTKYAFLAWREHCASLKNVNSSAAVMVDHLSEHFRLCLRHSFLRWRRVTDRDRIVQTTLQRAVRLGSRARVRGAFNKLHSVCVIERVRFRSLQALARREGKRYARLMQRQTFSGWRQCVANNARIRQSLSRIIVRWSAYHIARGFMCLKETVEDSRRDRIAEAAQKRRELLEAFRGWSQVVTLTKLNASRRDAGARHFRRILLRWQGVSKSASFHVWKANSLYIGDGEVVLGRMVSILTKSYVARAIQRWSSFVAVSRRRKMAQALSSMRGTLIQKMSAHRGASFLLRTFLAWKLYAGTHRKQIQLAQRFGRAKALRLTAACFRAWQLHHYSSIFHVNSVSRRSVILQDAIQRCQNRAIWSSWRRWTSHCRQDRAKERVQQSLSLRRERRITSAVFREWKARTIRTRQQIFRARALLHKVQQGYVRGSFKKWVSVYAGRARARWALHSLLAHRWNVQWSHKYAMWGAFIFWKSQLTVAGQEEAEHAHLAASDAAHALSLVSSESQLLSSLKRLAATHAPLCHVSLLVHDDSTDELYEAMEEIGRDSSYEDQQAPQLRFHASTGLCGLAFSSGQVITSEDSMARDAFVETIDAPSPRSPHILQNQSIRVSGRKKRWPLSPSSPGAADAYDGQVIAIPLKRPHGHPLGVLRICTQLSPGYDRDGSVFALADLFRSFADQAAATLHRVRVQRTLPASEDERRALEVESVRLKEEIRSLEAHFKRSERRRLRAEESLAQCRSELSEGANALREVSNELASARERGAGGIESRLQEALAERDAYAESSKAYQHAFERLKRRSRRMDIALRDLQGRHQGFRLAHDVIVNMSSLVFDRDDDQTHEKKPEAKYEVKPARSAPRGLNSTT